MTDNIQVDVVGLVITLTIQEDGAPVDISSATTTIIKIRKPRSRVVMDKAADFVTDGTDGQLTYTTIAGDVDEQGVYKVQAYLDMTSFIGYSTFVTFEALRNLS